MGFEIWPEYAIMPPKPSPATPTYGEIAPAGATQ